MKLGKPIKYVAVQPVEVVERVKKHMRSEAETKIKRLENIRNTEIIGELKNLHSQGIELIDPADLSGSIKGRHNLYNHLDLMIKNAQKSVTISTTSQGLLRKIEGLKPTMEKAKKRGVKIRIAAPITKEAKQSLTDVSDVADVRHSDMKARFCIVDGKDILFMVLNDKEVHPTYDVGIWVNTPFFASALEDMFDSSWRTMKSAAEVVKR